MSRKLPEAWPSELTAVGGGAEAAALGAPGHPLGGAGGDLQGIGLGGRSGHSLWRQLRFAGASYGPAVAILVAEFAKDMYILKLGADATRVGAISTCWSLLFPLLYPLAGQLMDREPPLLDMEGWGRRAPWFLTHLVPLGLVTGVVYLPGLAWLPPEDSPCLDIWLAVSLAIASWCLAVLVNAFESARVEIYPFQEERVTIVAMVKIIDIAAVGAGFVPQMLLWVIASLPARLAVSLFLAACVLLSLEAVPVLCDAQQPRQSVQRASLREALAILRRPPMAHATAVRFWQSAADTTALNFSIYYLTYVASLDSTSRSLWMLLAGGIVGVLEVAVLTPLWSLLWGEEPKSTWRRAHFVRSAAPDMRTMAIGCHVACSCLCPLILWLMPLVAPRPWEWVVSIVLLRICFSPQTFFRVNSFCWAVDEDCHRRGGERREALHAGVAKFWEDEGRAVAFALFVGLGRVGLQTVNCDLDCRAAENHRGCVEACELENIREQPLLVAKYVKGVMTLAVPLFGLLCALHVWLFPIHGGRLEVLQRTQAEVFKQTHRSGEREAVCSPRGAVEKGSKQFAGI